MIESEKHARGSGRQFGRPIPRKIAAVAEYLELFQLKIVTLPDLAAALRELGITDEDPVGIARELQRHGWLLPLRTRGRWEFAPAARAGAISSGDPFIELRATLQRRDLPVALAYDSAAWLQGLSTRQPLRQVLAIYPSQRRLPKALSDFRIVRTWGFLELEIKDHLPVWRVPTLLAKMALVPHHFRDWPSVADWLERAFKCSNPADLEREIEGAPAPARIRLAYLAKRAKFNDLSRSLMKRAPADAGVVYLGPRQNGRFVRDFNLVDSLLLDGIKN